jgi:hypothetical protein
MEHAINNKTLVHDEAAEKLITKLLLNISLVGNMRTLEKSKLVDSFLEEYGGIIYLHNIESLLQMMPQRPANSTTSKCNYHQMKVLGKLV